ncbi:MAG: SDR family oxidoreductase [Anaerolineales bacterium]
MARDIRKDFFFGKKALITGGSSGIGLALARQLVGRGASVWLTARNAVKLEAARKELQAAAVDPSQKVGFTPADVAVENQARTAVEQATRALGSLDLVFNSAGVTYPGYFQDLKAEIFREMMDINYFGTLNICRAVVPEMIRRGKGHLVNISSLVGLLATFGYSAYGASKWAVRGLSDTLRYELRQYGIRVSIAFPPDTDTPQLAFEEPIKPFETRVIASTNKVFPPETVVRDILNGVEKNRYIILTGFESKLFYLLTNLAGPLQYPIVDLVVADAIHKKKKAEGRKDTRV